jgi:hypothetical protein
MVQDLSGHRAILKHSVERLEDQVTTMQEGMETFGRVLNALRPQDGEAAGWTSNLRFLLLTYINFPRFLPIFPDFLEQLSHSAPIY